MRESRYTQIAKIAYHIESTNIPQTCCPGAGSDAQGLAPLRAKARWEGTRTGRSAQVGRLADTGLNSRGVD